MLILPMDALLASYFVQAVLASVFLVAIWGLVYVYDRPLHRVLAIGWTFYLVQLLASLLAAWYGRYHPESSSEWSTATAMLLGAIGSCVYWYTSIRIVAGHTLEATPPRAAIVSAVAVGALMIGASIISGRLLHQPGSGPLKLLYPVPYLLLAVVSWRASRTASVHRRLAVWLTAAFALFVVRLLLVMLVILPERSYRDGVPFSTLLGVATVQLLQIVSVGVISLAVAFLYERAAAQLQAERMHAAELRVQKSQRLEILGRLAAGIAHDFNNVLSAIKMGTDLAKMSSSDPEAVHTELTEIDAAVDRAQGLVRRLLPFAKATSAPTSSVEADAIIRANLPMLERLMQHQISLEMQTSAPGARVNIDATQLEQVLLNLVVNSLDATPPGGRITIQTRIDDVSAPRATRDSPLAVGRYVRLSVTDTGCGIPADVLPHVLKPFYTTKEQDRGTGIGLATVQQTVAAANGEIAIESIVGTGTCVDVYLPVAA